jgi:2-oxoglutarate dehydrogenase E2 component (dihydrolipoamide succinyltransferase)
MPQLIDIVIPSLGESVAEASIAKWLKADGAFVKADEILAELETDKATVELPAPKSGAFKPLVPQGATVKVGDIVARIDPAAAPSAAPATPPSNAGVSPAATAPSAPTSAKPAPAPSAKPAPAPAPAPIIDLKSAGLDDLSPAVRAFVVEHKLQSARIPATGPGGRLTKEDVLAYFAQQGEGGQADAAAAAHSTMHQTPEGVLSTLGTTNVPARPVPSPASNAGVPPAGNAGVPPAAFPRPLAEGEEREELSKLRQTLARRLVEAQHITASLTTFNEADMSAVIALRDKYKELFEKLHGIGLGFMSFFARAVIYAVRAVPQANYALDGNTLIKRAAVHLGIAVSTDRGLMVPVIRNAQNLSMADIESEIKRLAAKARDGKITVDDMAGGTFTITNGGVFGSLLSTPILNPPQAAILGMHKIQKRPVVISDNGIDTIAIRPMMYLALTYDHRIIDGKQSVTFLIKVKEALEDPARIMLGV